MYLFHENTNNTRIVDSLRELDRIDFNMLTSKFDNMQIEEPKYEFDVTNESKPEPLITDSAEIELEYFKERIKRWRLKKKPRKRKKCTLKSEVDPVEHLALERVINKLKRVSL
jgi:hypothetical protein